MIIPPTSWTAPLTWLTAILLITIAAISTWQISQQQNVSRGRKTIRLGLVGLLLLTLLGLWLQPRWRTQLPAGRVLLAADNVPGATVQAVQDSLHIRSAIRARAFRGATDSVTLVGQHFSDRIRSQLASQVVSWVPYTADDQLQSLHWKGIVQLGQNQVINGQIRLSEGGLIRLRFGKRTLDSTRILTGDQPFTLKYPVFALGRNSPTLWLGNTLLDTIRFVVRPTARMRIRFVLTAPDFETRNLADWLGQQGHQVELTNTLSKGIGSSVVINGSAAAKNVLPDLVITDPANVASAQVRSAVTAGKQVLVLNLTAPEADITTVNRALHTRWQVRRVPGKDTLHVGPILTALPYRFVPTGHLLAVPGYPVAVQPAEGRVGISLLTETFPLRLGGDSLAYNRLWLSILAQLQPPAANNFTVESPVYQHDPTQLTVNNPTTAPTYLRLGRDTITMHPAPIKTRSWMGTVGPARAGWQPLQDTLAVYVYPTETVQTGTLAELAQRQKTAAVALAHRRYDSYRPHEARFVERQLPDWAWFMLVVSILTALWIEPKLG